MLCRRRWTFCGLIILIFETSSRGWVNEQKDYHGEKIGEGNFEAYGHYTQVCSSSPPSYFPSLSMLFLQLYLAILPSHS